MRHIIFSTSNMFTNRIPWLFKASIFQSGKSKTVPFSATFTGDIISYEVSEFESGKRARSYY